MTLTLAQRTQLRKRAAQEAARTAPAALMDGLTSYELMLAKLQQDQQRLKQVQSQRDKGKVKATLLPEYVPYVDGILAAGQGAQDDVLVTIMVWRFDAADYSGGLDIAEYAIRHNLQTPNRFNRTTGCLVAEEVAEAALTAQKAGNEFPIDILTHFHFCCGLGGGAKGFNRAKPIVGNMQAEWECIGGVDVDPAGLADFERLSGVKGTLIDLFTRDQYIRFHGKEPPPGWHEAMPEDIRRAAGGRRPDAVFISSPCKGASGLLSETMSMTPKYQALNELTLRCIWLFGEAWKDDPVPLLVFENVPRLATRGRHLLDQIGALLSYFGYAVAETTHDCGVIGGLAQSRKRFLLVARHVEKVPPFLYEPEKKSLRAVGDILGRMPLAGDVERAGPMHRVPALQWKTWVRLALVEAGRTGAA